MSKILWPALTALAVAFTAFAPSPAKASWLSQYLRSRYDPYYYSYPGYYGGYPAYGPAYGSSYYSAPDYSYAPYDYSYAPYDYSYAPNYYSAPSYGYYGGTYYAPSYGYYRPAPRYHGSWYGNPRGWRGDEHREHQWREREHDERHR